MNSIPTKGLNILIAVQSIHKIADRVKPLTWSTLANGHRVPAAKEEVGTHGCHLCEVTGCCACC